MTSLILEPGESVVRYWGGNYETETKVAVKAGFGIRTKDAKDRELGVLVLTNQRLIWLKTRGMFGKSYHPSFAIPLEDVRGMSLGGKLMPFVTVADSTGSRLFHLRPIASSSRLMNEEAFLVFKQTVTFQMSQRKATLETKRKQDKVHLMLDFSFLRQYMEKGGLVVQTLKCTNCGAPLQIPQSGNIVNCPHCQASHHVDDIFQEVKRLLVSPLSALALGGSRPINTLSARSAHQSS